MSANSPSRPWWGPVPLAVDQRQLLEVGPFWLWMRRTADELFLSWATRELGAEVELPVRMSPADSPPTGGSDPLRVPLASTQSTLTLHPRLADRPVIARPETPYLIPPGGVARVHVSTPLWVGIDAHGPLLDLPLHRPPDTWFGTGPAVGELCYSARTHLRRRLDVLPRKPHRAITPVTIENADPVPLTLRRLRMPLPNLSAYVDASGHLWTQAITLTNEVGGSTNLSIHSGPPAAAGDAGLVAEPRQPPPNAVFKVINSFLP